MTRKLSVSDIKKYLSNSNIIHIENINKLYEQCLTTTSKLNIPNQLIPNNLSHNLSPGLSSNMSSNLSSNMSSNLSSGLSSNLSPNLSPGLSSNMSPNMSSNLSPNMSPNLSPGLSSNMSPNMSSNSSILDIYQQLKTAGTTTSNSITEQESDTISNSSNIIQVVSSSEYKKTLTNEIGNIPNLLSQYFNEKSGLASDSYYIYGTSNENSYLQSIILCLDENYRMLSSKKDSDLIAKKQNISSICKRFIDEHPEIKRLYKERKIVIKNISKKLFENNIDTHEDIKLFLANFYNINILLFNVKDKKYRIVNDYNSSLNTLVFLEDKYKYEPILSYKKNLLDLMITQVIFKHFIKYAPIRKMGGITKYKLKDLQDTATQMNIPIFHSVNNKLKKKLKSQLYYEIINNIKDI